MKRGPDLSHNNQVDLDQLASRSDFVIVKATEGATFADPAFAGWWRRLRELGKPRVAYHFARPGSSGDADDEARWFAGKVTAAGWHPGDAAMLDFEDPTTTLDPAALWQWAAAWVKTVQELLGSSKPVLFYTYPNYWTGRMGNPGRPIPGTLLNWARYTAPGTSTPATSPAPTPAAYPSPPAVWQFTDGALGKVIVPGLDWNQATDAAFAALFSKEDPLVSFTTQDLEDAAYQGAKKALNEGTAFGQLSWAKTEQAILGTVQSLVNLVKAAQTSLAAGIVDVRSSVLGAIAALPVPETDEQAQATAQKILDALAAGGVEGITADVILEALRHHPLAPAA